MSDVNVEMLVKSLERSIQSLQAKSLVSHSKSMLTWKSDQFTLTVTASNKS